MLCDLKPWPSHLPTLAPDSFQDKVFLVTGASKGIGRAVAKALGAHGAHLILLARSTPALNTLYEEIVASGGVPPKLHPFNLTNASPEDYFILAEHLEAQFGTLDGLLLNAASLMSLTPLEHYDYLQWQQVLQTNLNSQFLLLQACLPLLKKSNQASVVASVDPFPKAYGGAYAVSKYASLALLQVLQAELEDNTRVRINGLYPGPTRTQLRASAYPAEDKTQLMTCADLVPYYLYLLNTLSTHYRGQIFGAPNREADRQLQLPN